MTPYDEDQTLAEWLSTLPCRDGVILAYDPALSPCKDETVQVDCTHWKDRAAMYDSLIAQTGLPDTQERTLEGVRRVMEGGRVRLKLVHAEVPAFHIGQYFRRFLNMLVGADALDDVAAGSGEEEMWDQVDVDENPAY